jgi:hypothetical protein
MRAFEILARIDPNQMSGGHPYEADDFFSK